ncbi:hypothetical protein C8J57DRAFT_1520333 [Mycena rebaudengoi]|nr:hypothetical protein C8J57DRAFT_1520333 [Mycena rebaudengoi]
MPCYCYLKTKPHPWLSAEADSRTKVCPSPFLTEKQTRTTSSTTSILTTFLLFFFPPPFSSLNVPILSFPSSSSSSPSRFCLRTRSHWTSALQRPRPRLREDVIPHLRCGLRRRRSCIRPRCLFHRPLPERRARHPRDHQRRSLHKRSQSALTTPPAPRPLSLSRRCITRARDYGMLRHCGDVEVVALARYSIFRPCITPTRSVIRLRASTLSAACAALTSASLVAHVASIPPSRASAVFGALSARRLSLPRSLIPPTNTARTAGDLTPPWACPAVLTNATSHAAVIPSHMPSEVPSAIHDMPTCSRPQSDQTTSGSPGTCRSRLQSTTSPSSSARRQHLRAPT